MTSEAFFEQLDSHRGQRLPFVAYRKPNTDAIIAMLQKDETLYTTTEFTETGFVFAPFDDREDAVLIPLERSELCSVIPEKAGISSNEVKSSFVEDHTDKTTHIDLVQKGIDAITKGDLRKVVLSRTENVTLSESNPLGIFKRLLSKYPTAFVYCFYHPKVGLWLGATPETLLKIEGHQLFTTALAATQQYQGTMDVQWPAKEREEHWIVTNFIEGRLKSVVNHLKVGEVETVKAGSLLHLKTNISGTLDEKGLNFKHLLGTLHPTPAVCGLPKEEAKQFILEHEHYNREFYTGFLGELNLKKRTRRHTNRHNAEHDAFAAMMTVSNLFVNLRCVQLKSNNATIYVGGGITKDSNPEAEWEETVNKTQTIKSVL
ncbi:MAG TPA: chorismate-binding protein [Flavobacteriaceae bacterium]|nr:chorismate-binding protein [Flavobacteriaceae bacterium]